MLGQPQPDRHVLRTVLHQQGDYVAAPEALGHGPVRHPVGLGLDLVPAEGAVLEEQEGWFARRVVGLH